jgi:hypothetical protein
MDKFLMNLSFWIATPTLWAREDDCGKCPLLVFARSASDEAIQPFFLSSLRGQQPEECCEVILQRAEEPFA